VIKWKNRRGRLEAPEVPFRPMIHQPSTALFTATLLLTSLLLVATACSSAPPSRSRWQDWNTLRMEVDSSPLFSGKFEMRRTTRGAIEVLETRATAAVLGQRLEDSRTVTLFDSEGRTSRYARQSSKSGRRFVFGEQSYTVEKLEPPEEPGRPLDQWDVTSSREFRYPATAQGGSPQQVFDYFGMLLELRNAGLGEPGDETTLHVATSNGPRAFRIAVSESREGRRTFTDLATGIEQTVQLREFRLRIIPADPEQDGEGFLRMEGETEIWVEAESKTPLEISGRVPRVPGRVQLRLVAMG